MFSPPSFIYVAKKILQHTLWKNAMYSNLLDIMPHMSDAVDYPSLISPPH